jgi:hypothetical protein
VSGTGAVKALVDAERLCGAYVPRWLATPGMGMNKIAEYYSDPVKQRSDASSLRTSFFAKRIALGTGPLWSLARAATYLGARARHVVRHRTLADASTGTALPTGPVPVPKA